MDAWPNSSCESAAGDSATCGDRREKACSAAAEDAEGFALSRTTTDPSDPRLGHGVDAEPIDQHDVYLVLSEEERGKGFVRPYCDSYVHATELGGCGVETHMGGALSETYARDPHFYGATYCVGCRMHKPVGENGEFFWTRNLDGKPWKVGT